MPLSDRDRPPPHKVVDCISLYQRKKLYTKSRIRTWVLSLRSQAKYLSATDTFLPWIFNKMSPKIKNNWREKLLFHRDPFSMKITLPQAQTLLKGPRSAASAISVEWDRHYCAEFLKLFDRSGTVLKTRKIGEKQRVKTDRKGSKIQVSIFWKFENIWKFEIF